MKKILVIFLIGCLASDALARAVEKKVENETNKEHEEENEEEIEVRKSG